VIPPPKTAKLEIQPKPVENVFNAPAVEPPRPEPPREVRTNVFNEASSQKTALPARDVQTGGFGDPNGMRGEGRPGKAATAPSLGSFDLPAGEGVGNGTGGARGVRGAVASAGFGDSADTVSNRTPGKTPDKSVREGAFGSAPAAPRTNEPRKRSAPPAQIPVEITFKPRPEYTSEARSRKLEGEVLLKVLFTAAGQVQILELVKGLGYGLDESAAAAARQIRFTPAMRDGKPVDSSATIHIVFQLAY
jgi:TonB family protein